MHVNLIHKNTEHKNAYVLFVLAMIFQERESDERKMK